ncbi:unnamed protein product [Cylindrotheca closterium]|uniref:Uncharacterized protein n=1 Tax=Cylindrotheca closterium TaxID=2856 RepID=A0AAD2JJH5_9STRA|nr:unnamed protein product [Cylindrotheca closterium]
MHRRQTVKDNIHDNAEHARFVFLVSGEGSTSTFDAMQMSYQTLKNILAKVPIEIDAEILFAPGGVTYRHLFAAAMRFEEAFLVYNSDIAVGNLSLLLDSCGPNLDFGALVGSRTDTFRHANATKPTCFEYMNMGSFDIFMTNRKGLLVKGDSKCSFLNNLRFPQYYWGAENVVAFLLSTRKRVANICSRWIFRHMHESKTLDVQRGPRSRDRPNRIRINHQHNDWGGVETWMQNLSDTCNLDLLPPTEEGNFTKPNVKWNRWKRTKEQKLILAETFEKLKAKQLA